MPSPPLLIIWLLIVLKKITIFLRNTRDTLVAYYFLPTVTLKINQFMGGYYSFYIFLLNINVEINRIRKKFSLAEYF